MYYWFIQRLQKTGDAIREASESEQQDVTTQTTTLSPLSGLERNKIKQRGTHQRSPTSSFQCLAQY